MTKFFLKNFIIFLSVVLVSCSSKGDTKKIRIVDLQGKSHAVKTKVPELNAQILESQGKLQQEESMFGDASNGQQGGGNLVAQDLTNQGMPNQEPVQNKYPTADYNAASLELAKQNSQQIAQAQSDAAMPTEIKPSKISAGTFSADKVVEVEYDLSDSKKSKKKFKMASAPAKHEVSADASAETSTGVLKGIFVQTGAFSTMNNAEKSSSAVQKFAKVQIEESANGDQKIYRVLLGPFANKAKANQVIAKIKKTGHEAIIVRKK